MSEDNAVVIEESNPTNEDHSIDNAINALYESAETEDVTTPAEEVTPEEGVEPEEKDTPEEQEEIIEDVEGEFKLPENMPKELQDSLLGFDEEVQKNGAEVFKKMQGSFTKKNQDFAEEKKLAEPVNEVFNNSGLNVKSLVEKQTLVSNYVAFDKLIATDPKAAVQQLMNHAGLSAQDLGASQTPTDSSDDEFLTDDEIRTNKQINTLTEQVKQLTQRDAQTREQAQSKIVDDFFDAKDESGNLVNPHFDLVYEDMKVLAAGNPRLTIDQLYTKAVRMNDDLYNQNLEREKKSAQDELGAKRKAEVEKAKKLNRQSRPTSSADSTVVDQDSIFEQIASDAGWK